MLLSIPEHWLEVPQEEENTLCYQYQDELAETIVYAGWYLIPEGVAYADMQENLQAISSVTCNANKSGFEWCVGNTAEGIGVYHVGEDGYCYALLFIIDVKDSGIVAYCVVPCTTASAQSQ